MKKIATFGSTKTCAMYNFVLHSQSPFQNRRANNSPEKTIKFYYKLGQAANPSLGGLF